MIRPTVARVDLGAITRNFRRIIEYLARERPERPPQAIAVVKANAYGHGAGQVARALEDAGADLLACADIEEGAALRAAGVQADILIFGALSVSDLDGLFDCALTPTISTPGAARAVQAAAAKYKRRLPYHLKIDTGMNRLGFRYDNLRRTLPELLASENLELQAVYTHFRDRRRSRLAALQRAAAPVRARAGRGRRHQPRSRQEPLFAPKPRARQPGVRTCTRATAPRCCGTRACGTTASVPACSCTASFRRRSRRRSRSSRR